jgi:hypothetical protein
MPSPLKVELNLPNITVSAVAAVIVGTTFGLPLAVAAGIGAAAAAIKFDFAYIRKGKQIPDCLKD